MKCLYGASLLAGLQTQRSSKGAGKADGCKTQQQEGPCGLLGRSQAIQMRASKVLGQIHSNAFWGPYPSATLSCRRLAGIRPSARHLPLLSRSVACQKSAYPGHESVHRTNANSARHASAGGIRRQALKHCSPARRGRRTRVVGRLTSLNLSEQSSSRALLWLGVTVATSISAGIVAGPLSRRERAARIWKSRLGLCLSGTRVWKEHPGVGTLTAASCVRCNSREATNTRACSARHTADGLSYSAGQLLTTSSTFY